MERSMDAKIIRPIRYDFMEQLIIEITKINY